MRVIQQTQTSITERIRTEFKTRLGEPISDSEIDSLLTEYGQNKRDVGKLLYNIKHLSKLNKERRDVFKIYQQNREKLSARGGGLTDPLNLLPTIERERREGGFRVPSIELLILHKRAEADLDTKKIRKKISWRVKTLKGKNKEDLEQILRFALWEFVLSTFGMDIKKWQWLGSDKTKLAGYGGLYPLFIEESGKFFRSLGNPNGLEIPDIEWYNPETKGGWEPSSKALKDMLLSYSGATEFSVRMDIVRNIVELSQTGKKENMALWVNAYSLAHDTTSYLREGFSKVGSRNKGNDLLTDEERKWPIESLVKFGVKTKLKILVSTPIFSRRTSQSKASKIFTEIKILPKGKIAVVDLFKDKRGEDMWWKIARPYRPPKIRGSPS